MSNRQAIVVDTETTSLNTQTCTILEVAAINLTTGETLRFVPFIDATSLAEAEPIALSVNRYYERRLFEETQDRDSTARSYSLLTKMLRGNSLAGSNPRFDAAVLKRVIGEVWHHRLPDLSSYAAGVLGLPITELLGLDKVCEKLDITNIEPHSALGDAQATVECFHELARLTNGARA